MAVIAAMPASWTAGTLSARIAVSGATFQSSPQANGFAQPQIQGDYCRPSAIVNRNRVLSGRRRQIECSEPVALDRRAHAGHGGARFCRNQPGAVVEY